MSEVSEARTGADLVADCLVAEGVTHVFGLPGTTVMDLIDAVAQNPHLRYLSTRHEQVAGFMADGFSRAGDTLGVCLASRGPGAANLSIAVQNAHDESIPMLALIGQVPGSITERRAFEEMNVVAAFRPLCKWVVEIHQVDRIPELLQRAVRTAVSGRPGPVVVSLPLDVLQAVVTAVPGPRTGSTPRPPPPRASPRRPGCSRTPSGRRSSSAAGHTTRRRCCGWPRRSVHPS
ncbi:thiamine pyrophosphate-binding protein [Pseudonocardia benzenivorans]